MADDLKSEPIADAIKRGDRILQFTASNGRENGPYDLDDFAIKRPTPDGDMTIVPIGLDVNGTTMTARFNGPLLDGDTVA